jgi:two-component system chemotaxis response regulator CheY
MVVDDVAAIRQIVCSVLEQARHRVVTARDGAEALALAQVQRVHLILTDVNMPGLNGLDLITRLRAIRNCRNTPLLILANGANDENIGKARELGACGWIVKPFTPEGLTATVNQVLVDTYVNH